MVLIVVDACIHEFQSEMLTYQSMKTCQWSMKRQHLKVSLDTAI